ncbi:MAG: hypothetical protein RMH84_05405 [Sulfolobales archaeon]|nr:hypothetical protein [Sulfolobales archaeon]MCX8208909.1 hypothetical protein [Sulfolobales archaeon]MDW8011012.1 hypothetical protein [Sulfolobales archaeon]
MPKIAVNLSSEQVEALSKMFPDLPVEDALLKIVSSALSSGKPLKTEDRSMKTLIDTINAYTGKIDEVSRKISHVIELIEDLVARVQSLEEQVRSIPQVVQQVKLEEKREVRKSAIDILKEQKIMFESDIAGKIKNRDAFFEKLKRSGAVVIELAKERVAVDREFFSVFVENVGKLAASSEEALSKELSRDEVKLLKALMNSGLAYFDSTRKKWVIDVDV